jgi:hypothetical protein
MQRVAYQNLDNKWSTTSIVAFVATASLAVGVTAGVAASSYTNAQTSLYAPVATTVRPAAMTMAPVTQMGATQNVNEVYGAPEEAIDAEYYETVQPVMYQAAQPASNNWALAFAGAVSAAVGAVVYKIKSQKQVPTIGALSGASLLAAEPAFAMQTNSLAPIATALFIILPTFLLITLFVSSNANKDNLSGGFDQDYYDRSEAANKKLTNDAAPLKGAGLGMYASKRSQQ